MLLEQLDIGNAWTKSSSQDVARRVRDLPRAMRALAMQKAPRKYKEDLHFPLLDSLPMMVGPEKAAHRRDLA